MMIRMRRRARRGEVVVDDEGEETIRGRGKYQRQ
jgi:hypothetical protein